MQSVFVTGASGFIGSHLVSELTRRGAEVKCLVRPSSRVEQLRGAGIELVCGDLASPERLREAVGGCDTVIHLAGLVAALRKRQLFEVNGGGCAAVARACAECRRPPRVVYVSSAAAAGPPPPGKSLRDEADAPAPLSNYGRSKRAGEVEFQALADRMPVTVVRPGMVFGPGDRASAAIFRAIHRARLHLVVGFRTPRLSIIYIDDLVQLVLKAAERGETLPAPGSGDDDLGRGFYFACDDSEHPTYWRLGERIAQALRQPTMVWPIWRWAGLALGAASQATAMVRGQPTMLNLDKIRESLASSWACAGGKARSQLGFATPQPLDDRLRQTADWYREHGWL